MESSSANASQSRVIPSLLLLVGVWGLVAPYAGTAMGLVIPGLQPKVEVVDHVVPGLVIVPVALYAMFSGRVPFVGSLAAVLAAFWMTATHVLLLRDAGRNLVSWGTALWHSAPGVLGLIIAGAMAVKAYREAPSSADEAGQA
ncbi:MAG: hypothetical protein ACRDIU_01965 [Actinomycetota bacterium]